SRSSRWRGGEGANESRPVRCPEPARHVSPEADGRRLARFHPGRRGRGRDPVFAPPDGAPPPPSAGRGGAEAPGVVPPPAPAPPSLDAYGKVADVIDSGRSFLNSAIIATITTAGILLTSLLAGFAFAKYRFRGREWVFAGVIATMFLPPIVTLIPLYRMVGY